MTWILYKEVRYQLDGIPDSTLTDFPKLIKITTDADIAAEIGGGGGIKFTSADGLTDLSFGLYPTSNLAAGTIVARVKLTLSSTASVGEAMCRIYYSASESTTEDKAGTVVDYLLFMPLEEDPGGSAPQMYDWVSESYVGTVSGDIDQVSGQVGNGLLVNDTSSYVTIPFSDTPANITVEAIVALSGANAKYAQLLTTYDGSDVSSGFAIGWRLRAFDDLSFNVYNFDAVGIDGQGPNSGSNLPTDNSKHHYAGTYDGSTSSLFIDGVSVGTPVSYSGGIDYSNIFGTVDNIRILVQQFDGGNTEDEIRVSSVARSEDWLGYVYIDDFLNGNTFLLSSEDTAINPLAAKVPYVIAAWRLNEVNGNAPDYVGSSNLTDNVSVGSNTGKLYTLARDFEQDNTQGLYVNDNVALSGGDFDFCLRTWMYVESLPASVASTVYKWNSLSGGCEWGFGVTSAGAVFFGASPDGEDAGTFAFSSPISTGVWCLAHGWHDSTANTVNICINAGTPATGVFSAGLFDGNAPLTVGYASAGQYFDGRLQDLLLMKNTFLNATERTLDYNGGSGIRFSAWDAAVNSGDALFLSSSNLLSAGTSAHFSRVGTLSNSNLSPFGSSVLSGGTQVLSSSNLTPGAYATKAGNVSFTKKSQLQESSLLYKPFLIVTRGFGNNVFAANVGQIPTRGYLIGSAGIVHDGAAAFYLKSQLFSAINKLASADVSFYDAGQLSSVSGNKQASGNAQYTLKTGVFVRANASKSARSNLTLESALASTVAKSVVTNTLMSLVTSLGSTGNKQTQSTTAFNSGSVFSVSANKLMSTLADFTLISLYGGTANKTASGSTSTDLQSLLRATAGSSTALAGEAFFHSFSLLLANASVTKSGQLVINVGSALQSLASKQVVGTTMSSLQSSLYALASDDVSRAYFNALSQLLVTANVIKSGQASILTAGQLYGLGGLSLDSQASFESSSILTSTGNRYIPGSAIILSNSVSNILGNLNASARSGINSRSVLSAIAYKDVVGSVLFEYATQLIAGADSSSAENIFQIISVIRYLVSNYGDNRTLMELLAENRTLSEIFSEIRVF